MLTLQHILKLITLRFFHRQEIYHAAHYLFPPHVHQLITAVLSKVFCDRADALLALS